MPGENDKYHRLAKEFVKKLEATVNPSVKPHHDHFYVCMEAEPCFSGDDPNPHYYLHYRLSHLNAGHITNAPSIPLPNGNHFFTALVRDKLLLKYSSQMKVARAFVLNPGKHCLKVTMNIGITCSVQLVKEEVFPGIGIISICLFRDLFRGIL